jgi:hypothetical protein
MEGPQPVFRNILTAFVVPNSLRSFNIQTFKYAIRQITVMLTDDIPFYQPKEIKYYVLLPDIFISPAEDLFL